MSTAAWGRGGRDSGDGGGTTSGSDDDEWGHGEAVDPLDALGTDAFLAQLRRGGVGAPEHPPSRSTLAALNQQLRVGPPRELRPDKPSGCCCCIEPQLYDDDGYKEVWWV